MSASKVPSTNQGHSSPSGMALGTAISGANAISVIVCSLGFRVPFELGNAVAGSDFQHALRAFIGYSGATAREFHPLPSPRLQALSMRQWQAPSITFQR